MASQQFDLIKKVVDKYFHLSEQTNGNPHMNANIPDSMRDKSRKSESDDEWSWGYWKPIPGTVTSTEISELESYLGHELPDSFKFFLQYLHFVEIQIGQYGIIFFPNLPGQLTARFRKEIEFRYSNLLSRNYLPFAHLSDYGVLCFDATKKVADNDYEIVMFDHEDGYDREQDYDSSFLQMFTEFDESLNTWMENLRKMKNESDKGL